MTSTTGRQYRRGNSTRGLKELTRDVRETAATLDVEALRPELFEERPRTRGDCVDAPRPCPWVSCRHHLYLDANDCGSITFNHPDTPIEELEETCALDVADKGGVILERVGELMNLTRERVRQIEAKAMRQAGRRGLERHR